LGYYYFPFIKNIYEYKEKIKSLNDNNYDLVLNDKDEIGILIDKQNHDEIKDYLTDTLLSLIILNSNYTDNINSIKLYSEMITFFISKITHRYKINLDELMCILKKISFINKKVFEKIENYSIKTLYKIFFFESNDNLSNLSSFTVDILYLDKDSQDDEKSISEIINSREIVNLKNNIEKYISLTEIYLMLKTMSFLLVGNKTIIKIAKLFSNIIKIYDEIDVSIHKIRRISNSCTELHKIFLIMLSNHIFMKKNGFCKKDY
jgi:hypothetical protein